MRRRLTGQISPLTSRRLRGEVRGVSFARYWMVNGSLPLPFFRFSSHTVLRTVAFSSLLRRSLPLQLKPPARPQSVA
jgi:hypothetical protein